MERKKRGYERLVTKKRDYRLFAIACEGSVREIEYFEKFEVLSSRISVDLIGEIDEEGNIINSRNSSPDHVLDRASKYYETAGLTDDDELWLVLDVDRWPKKDLSHLYQESFSKGWHVAISNPCFEVWLCYHMEKDIPDRGIHMQSKYFKAHLHTLTSGGYSPEIYVPLAFDAIENAKDKDIDPDSRIPDYKVTHVYRLMENMRNYTSKSELDKFIKKNLLSA